MGAADNNILHDDVIIFDVAVVHYIYLHFLIIRTTFPEANIPQCSKYGKIVQ